MKWKKRGSLLGIGVTTIAAASVILFLLASRASAQESNPRWYEEFGSNLYRGSNVPILDTKEIPSLQGLSISGFVQNESGMWVNSANLVPFGRLAGEHHGANSLAVERNWLQLDTNYTISPQNKFFLRFWGVYEPRYPFDNEGTGTPFGLPCAGCGNGLSPVGIYQRGISQFYNRYDVRDAWWKDKFGPLTLFLGRQIVTWGESVAFRVGDVINPQDFSWAFGFANLEQSRLPVWMVHPILNLPDFGTLTSNFAEGVWVLPWQPLYTSVNYSDERYSGHSDSAGSVTLFAPSGSRFDFYPYNCLIPAFCAPGQQAAFPQAVNFTNPITRWQVPGVRLANSMEGFRLHTVAWNTEMTAIFWHAHQLSPGTYVTGNPTAGQGLAERYPQLNDAGVTANRPIYLPGSILSQIPFVLRTEGVIQDRTPFNTLDTGVSNATVDKTTLNTLVALDNDGISAPWLTRTGTLSTILEWQNYDILSSTKNLVYSYYAEHWRHAEENLLLSASTSWYWGAIAPTLSGIYNPDGDTFLLFPSLLLTPPWTDKYFLNLLYIGILSNDKYSSYAGGVFKGKSTLVMQFQYNFEAVGKHM